ncbi:MATE family efflux transporter [Rhodobacteraceae bacterium RKSG542]|uniref:MATE family efflux transporter n=1 Tax=Pseudovibrio flavus TaxID=2529854 RepID=UPI0012BC95D5|nr:MATE family efflux transporter [Pseudovibrio flavus]MTI16122.1 MATE family efflux transporter [Pseudovibrio flavus]
MTVQVAEERMLTGSTTLEFLRFVVPSVIGLLAVSSAGIVDGIFIGNYVGPIALAAINLVIPLYSLFFGLSVMMLVGGAVMAGKALGAGNTKRASNLFTKSTCVIVAYSLLVATLAFFYAENIAAFLGAQEHTLPLAVDYIRILAPFLFFMGVAYTLSYFSRIDNAPNYALAGLIIISLVNMVLDALFIGVWGWGIGGAALATGIANVLGAVFLFVRFFGKSARIRFIKPYGSWLELFRAAYNGLSEFINEMSGGLIMFVINWILMLEIGASGVAAFTIVNYILWLSIMIAYGTAEALGPLVSVNFGAKKPERIARFMKLAIGSTVVVGGVLVALLLMKPETLASAFIKSGDTRTLEMTLAIIAVIWPAFLFNGINITISGYFTGMHCATQSAIIALSRSLVLPLILILLFWKTFGVNGAFVALPVSEAVTFILSLVLFYKAKPTAVVGRDKEVFSAAS